MIVSYRVSNHTIFSSKVSVIASGQSMRLTPKTTGSMRTPISRTGPTLHKPSQAGRSASGISVSATRLPARGGIGKALKTANTTKAARVIDIPNRSINLLLPDDELAERRKKMEARGKNAYTPATRKRKVSAALQAYAALTISANRGAVRDVSQVQRGR